MIRQMRDGDVVSKSKPNLVCFPHCISAPTFLLTKFEIEKIPCNTHQRNQ